jgi:spore coat protein CotH
MRPLLSLCLLAACAPTELDRDDRPQQPKPQQDDDTTIPDTSDTGLGLVEDTDVEDIVGDGEEKEEEKKEEVDNTGQYFDLSVVHRADLTLSQDAIISLGNDPYTYVEAGLTFDGEALETVGVRIKGRLGSYRDLSGKPALKIDLNRYHDQELDGLERLNFNNMVQDGAMTHEIVAYALFNAVGVVAPRVGYVWVTINGSDYGLYSHVEVYDDTWLSRSYDDPTGNLYDGDYFLYDNGSYTFIDFDGSTEHLFALDEGEDVNREDLLGITRALDGAGPDVYTDLSEVVDMDQFLLMWATETWLGHYDGYAFNDNNYRVYFDPSDGRARFHPWDPDWAFYSSTPITSPSGELAYACWRSTPCKARFIEAVDEVSEIAKTAGLQELLGEASALIQPYVTADPRREYSAASVSSSQGTQMSWINNRDQTLAGYGM